MRKETWKPGNMLYPVPAVMVSCADREGHANIITVAWAGTVCSDPAMLSISVRPERFSYEMLCDTGEFVVNLVSRELAFACDWCGVRSGRDFDKWTEMGLTPEPCETLEHAPAITEAPVNIECKVRQVLELGSHHMFIAEVTAVRVDAELLDDAGKLHLERADLVAYSHGEYFELGRSLGTFGYSVRKKPPKPASEPRSKPRPVQRSGSKQKGKAKSGSGQKPGSGISAAGGGEAAVAEGGRAAQKRGGKHAGSKPALKGKRRPAKNTHRHQDAKHHPGKAERGNRG